MRNYPKLTYTNEEGKIISAAQGRILERRIKALHLYNEMLPNYASFQTLYQDIANQLCEIGYYCSWTTVRHDLELMGVLKNTQQSRMANNIRKP